MKNSFWGWYRYGGKIPRKIKKLWLNKRLRRRELKSLIASVRIGEPIKTMYERPIIAPFTFCPYCGETGYVGTGNNTSYPEHWEYFLCLRCRETVGIIDNSPFYHVLEYVNDPCEMVFKRTTIRKREGKNRFNKEHQRPTP